MTKYKLVKEYPGSCKLGTIKEAGWNEEFFLNYPEFWQKMIGDWEILAFRFKDKEQVITLRPHGRYIIEGSGDDTYAGGKVWELLKNDSYHIYSIKRLCDGETFTIGDRVTQKDNTLWKGVKNCVLESITMDEFIFTFHIRQNDSLGDYKIVNNYPMFVKLGKPLFVTEDGVEIFEDEPFYAVGKYSLEIKTEKTIGVHKDHFNILANTKTYVLFSDKEAANEYVLMNKACLSINDVINLAHINRDTQNLKELVRLKL